MTLNFQTQNCEWISIAYANTRLSYLWNQIEWDQTNIPRTHTLTWAKSSAWAGETFSWNETSAEGINNWFRVDEASHRTKKADFYWLTGELKSGDFHWLQASFWRFPKLFLLVTGLAHRRLWSTWPRGCWDFVYLVSSFYVPALWVWS